MTKERDVAEIVIFNKKGDLMLQKKTVDYPTMPGGYWCFFGGEIECGEDPKDTIKREVKEEIGIVLEDVKSIGVRDYVIDGKYHGKEHVFSGIFNGKLSDIRLNEGAGFAFFEMSEVEKIKIPEMELRILVEYFGLKK
jgi:mutator protein MutT